MWKNIGKIWENMGNYGENIGEIWGKYSRDVQLRASQFSPQKCHYYIILYRENSRPPRSNLKKDLEIKN